MALLLYWRNLFCFHAAEKFKIKNYDRANDILYFYTLCKYAS